MYMHIHNIERCMYFILLQDFHDQMYEGYYLNFISAISRQKLEDLALSAIQNNVVASVAKVRAYFLLTWFFPLKVGKENNNDKKK